MQLFRGAILAIVASAVHAVPNALKVPAYCAAASSNTCALAVTSATPVIIDCASFVRSTVMPCPVTSTTTVTQYSTAFARTVTTYASTTWTHTSQTTSIVATSTQAQYAIATSTASSVQTVTNPATSTTTVTSVSMITVPATTVTLTTTITQAAVRRDVAINPRAGACMQQSTVLPSDIPAYAAACGAASVYQSACSCLGVTSIVTTWPVPTVLATSTRTVRTVKTSTLTQTILFNGPTEISTILGTSTTQSTSTFTVFATVLATTQVTSYSTQTVYATTSTTITNPALTATATTTATTTSTSTTKAPTATACNIQQVSGGQASQFLWIDNGNDPNAWIGYWSSGNRGAPTWYLDSNGYLTSDTFGVGRKALALANKLSFVYLSVNLTPGQGGYYPIACSVQQGGILSCSNTDGFSVNNFFATSQGIALQLGNSSDVDLSGRPLQPITVAFVC